MMPTQVLSHTITPAPSLASPQIAPDGSHFYSNSAGDLVFAEYSSGAVVSILKELTAVRTAGGDFWIVNSSGFSFRMD